MKGEQTKHVSALPAYLEQFGTPAMTKSGLRPRRRSTSNAPRMTRSARRRRKPLRSRTNKVNLFHVKQIPRQQGGKILSWARLSHAAKDRLRPRPDKRLSSARPKAFYGEMFGEKPALKHLKTGVFERLIKHLRP